VNAPDTLTLVDGDTGDILSVEPWTSVPESNRVVYYRNGLRLDAPAEDAEAVPIARILRFSRDAQGNPVSPSQATRIYLHELAADGTLLREHAMTRHPSS